MTAKTRVTLTRASVETNMGDGLGRRDVIVKGLNDVISVKNVHAYRKYVRRCVPSVLAWI